MLPAVQAEHARPLDAENWPAPQLVQRAEPDAVATVPAGHATQVVLDAAPVALDDVPAAQLEQVVVPVVLAKLPEAHARQEVDDAAAELSE